MSPCGVEPLWSALPLYGGQLFNLVATGAQPQLEEMQIRYLEVLLRKRRRDSQVDGVGGSDSGSANP